MSSSWVANLDIGCLCMHGGQGRQADTWAPRDVSWPFSPDKTAEGSGCIGLQFRMSSVRACGGVCPLRQASWHATSWRLTADII